MMATNLSEMITSGQQSGPGAWLAAFGDAGRCETGGPDASGDEHARVKAVSSGRRLRLLDGPGSVLPAIAEDAFCTVIFVGVLYNREELQNRFAGAFVPASSDASLVLQVYLRCGEEVLRRVKGIFALIIWDKRHDILLCARDPLGVYPLFYADTERELLL